MRRAILALALLLAALPAAAQTTTLAVGAEAGDARELGYVPPLWGVWGQSEHQTDRFVLGLFADWSPDHKYGVRVLAPGFAPEWSVAADLYAYARLGPLLAGVCADYSITRTSEYTKDGLRWCVSAGFQVPIGPVTFRATGDKLMAGTDRSNDLSGYRVSWRADVPLDDRRAIRLGMGLGFYDFRASEGAFDPSRPRPEYRARTYVVRLGLARTL